MRRTFDWAPDYWRSTWRNWWMVARGGCCWWGRAERDGGRVIGQMRSSRSWRPVRMESIVLAGSLPMRSVSSVLSMVRIWDTLMTLALGRLAAPFSSGTLARPVWLVWRLHRPQSSGQRVALVTMGFSRPRLSPKLHSSIFRYSLASE